MAVYRQVHTTFWQDPFVLDNLDYKEKYFYLYLMTNSKTTQCGIYEISEGVMKLETGLPSEEINIMLAKFEKKNKIKYNKETKEIFLINWIKYNPVNNTNIEKCVLKELKDLKSEEYRNDLIKACISLQFKIPLINKAYEGLIRGLYTPTKKEEEEEEEEKEKEKEEEKEREQESLLQLSNLWTHCGYGTLNSNTLEKLETDIEMYSWPWVKEAIEIGDMRGKRSYSYVKGILNRWNTDGKEEPNEPGRKNSDPVEKPRRKYGRQRTEEELDAIDVNDPNII